MTRPHMLRTRPRTAGGFTLVELMVGIALSSIVLFALVVLFGNNSRARNEIDQAAQQVENGRYALDLIRDDLHLAGYYGDVIPQSGFKPAYAVAPSLTEICGTAVADVHLNLSPLQWPVPVFGIANGDAVPTCVSSATGGYKAGTDVLIVRRTSTIAAGARTAGDIYVQASGCNTELQQHKDFVRDVGSATTFVLKKSGCAAAADVYRYETHVYYISNETVPTLRLLKMSGTTSTNEPLVEGIEDIRFQYGRDTNSNGAADEYRNCLSTVDPCSTTEWANMMAVRINLLARNVATVPGHVDTKTYALGPSTVGPFNDGYRRHAYNGVVRLMNPAGLRE